MSKPSFVYTTYINASADAIWAGLLEPEFTRQYWLHDNVSDWQVGSRWEHLQAEPPEGVEAPWPVEPGRVDIVGEVLESERPTRLVLSWVEPKHEGQAEKTSRVAFDLEPIDWPGGPWTKLVVSHTEMDDHMAASVSEGWPMLLSGLKTLLEVTVARGR